MSTTETLVDLQHKHTHIEHSPGTHWQTKFSHLNGYGAGYYSYLWARVFSSNIWGKLFEDDPLSREAGEQLRDKLLMHGGAKDPEEMLQSLLGDKYASHACVMKDVGC